MWVIAAVVEEQSPARDSSRRGLVARHPAASGSSAPTIDGNVQGLADLFHAVVTQSTEPFDENANADALDRVQVDGRRTGHRIVPRDEYDLAWQTANRCGARSDQRSAQSRDRRVAGQHDDWPSTDIRQLAPPDLSPRRNPGHEAAAASRKDARSPHSSGSASGCSSYAA